MKAFLLLLLRHCMMKAFPLLLLFACFLSTPGCLGETPPNIDWATPAR